MEELKFIMRDRAFENGDRLDKVAAGLTGLQHFFDDTYRALTAKERISKQDRQNFRVLISRYEESSFITFLGAVYSGLQPSLPFFYSFTPSELWDYTTTAYEFLKLVFGLAHEKASFSISQDGEGNVAVQSGETTNNFYGPVFQIGTQIIGGLRDFDNLLEEDEVKHISLGRPTTEDVRLTLDEKGLFFPPTTVDENPIRLSCDIYDFNKYENEGRAHIGTDQPIPEGNYKFKNIGSRAVEEFILSMTEVEVRLHCLIKYEHDPLTKTKIAEILVTDIAA
jgi:hypothetical protein